MSVDQVRKLFKGLHSRTQNAWSMGGAHEVTVADLRTKREQIGKSNPALVAKAEIDWRKFQTSSMGRRVQMEPWDEASPEDQMLFIEQRFLQHA